MKERHVIGIYQAPAWLQVLELMELAPLASALVGVPGVTREQRCRNTKPVETLVALIGLR